MTEVVVETLSGAALRSHLGELMALDGVVEGERWDAESFSRELPGKFEYSRIALEAKGQVVGFAIASRKGERVHVHRLAVRESHQRSGIGQRLIAAVASAGLRDELMAMTLKVAANNEAARHFYGRLGFEVQEQSGEALQMIASNHDLVAESGVTGRTSTT